MSCQVDYYQNMQFPEQTELYVPEIALQIEHQCKLSQLLVEDYICNGKQGKQYQRKIFYHTQLYEFELKEIEKMKQVLQKMEIMLPEYLQTDQEMLKLILIGKMGDNYYQTAKQIQVHLQWRAQKEMHTLSDKVIEKIQKGVMYQLGRDKEMRPIIHINFSKIDKESHALMQQIMCYLCSYVKKNMFLEGKIENWVWILDINGKGVLSFPFKLLKQLIVVTQINYVATLHRFYVFNPSFSLNSIWNMIKQLLDEVVQKKIQFVPIKQVDMIHKDIDLNQLEKKFGGTLDDLEQGQYMPFRNTIGHLKRLETSKNQKSIAVKQEDQMKMDDLISQDYDLEPEMNKLNEQELQTQQNFKQSINLLTNQRQYKFMEQLQSNT